MNFTLVEKQILNHIWDQYMETLDSNISIYFKNQDDLYQKLSALTSLEDKGYVILPNRFKNNSPIDINLPLEFTFTRNVFDIPRAQIQI